MHNLILLADANRSTENRFNRDNDNNPLRSNTDNHVRVKKNLVNDSNEEFLSIFKYHYFNSLSITQ